MEEVVALDIAWLSLIASVFLPLVVGIVTKQLASSALKSTVLLFLSAVNGVVSSAITDHGILTKETLVAAVISFVVAVGTYYGWLKPAGVAPAVQEKTANVGLGPSQ